MDGDPTPRERDFWLRTIPAAPGIEPWWRGPIKNKRWRLMMAYRALRGWEFGGFRSST